MKAESRIERAERFAKIWWQSRMDAGKSQEYLAMGLGVSRKTIQNWEKGLSSPDFFQGCEWFDLLGLNPLRYYMRFLYPNMFEGQIDQMDETKLNNALMSILCDASVTEKRQLLFLIQGNHGSSWSSLLQMFTAHCHTNMQARVTTARSIYENYLMEEAKGTLVCPDEILPDIDNLKLAIKQGKNAVFRGEKGYTTALGENED